MKEIGLWRSVRVIVVGIGLAVTTSGQPPGTLDPFFGTGGRIYPPINSQVFERASDGVVQPDGKILLAGSIADGNFPGYTLQLYRYLTDGQPDPDFGTNGRVRPNLIGVNGARAVALQPDAKIAVLTDRSVIRFLNNGVFDASFGVDGRAVLPGLNNIYYMAVQSDGKIVVAGTRWDPKVHMYLLVAVRYLADGSSDSSFGEAGMASVSFGAGVSYFDESGRVAIQSDGKIVVAAVLYLNGSLQTGLARFTSNGAPDESFGTEGKALVPFAAQKPLGLAVQSDNKAVVVGQGELASGYTSYMIRFKYDGSVDTAFGDSGVVSPNSWTSNVAVDKNGKLVVGGSNTTGHYLSRFLPDGTLDATFGTNGVVGTSFPDLLGDDGCSTGGGEVVALAIQRDGKIVSAGSWESFRPFDSAPICWSYAATARYIGDLSRTPFDFDGDGKTDIAIFRPTVGEWWINRSSNGSTVAAQFGALTDSIVPADFTGDGKADIAFWRPSSGEWFVLRSEDSSYFAFPFGTNGDIPVPADYDADGKADPAVFRPSSSLWFIQRSSDNGTTIQQWGSGGDVPVAADYDGDGRADIAIYRPSVGQWWIQRSSAGVMVAIFGNSNDRPVQGDYSGDGKSDAAFWRPTTGEWFILRSEDFSYYSFPFGISTDIPAPGDYDGDGKFDATVFRGSAGTWFSQRTTAGTLIQQFGASGDRPLPNAYIP